MFQRVAHQVRKLVRIHRLGDVIVGAHFEGLHRRLHGGIAGHDDDRELRIGLAQARLQFHAVHAGHFDIDERNIELGLLDDLQRLARAAYRPGREPFAGKPLTQRIAHHQFVVDDQYFALGLRRACRFYRRCHLFLPLTAAPPTGGPSKETARAAGLTPVSAAQLPPAGNGCHFRIVPDPRVSRWRAAAGVPGTVPPQAGSGRRLSGRHLSGRLTLRRCGRGCRLALRRIPANPVTEYTSPTLTCLPPRAPPLTAAPPETPSPPPVWSALRCRRRVVAQCCAPPPAPVRCDSGLPWW